MMPCPVQLSSDESSESLTDDKYPRKGTTTQKYLKPERKQELTVSAVTELTSYSSNQYIIAHIDGSAEYTKGLGWAVGYGSHDAGRAVRACR